MPPITVTVVQVCFVINCSGEVNWGQIALSVKTNSLSLALFFFSLCSWSGYTWRDRQSPPAAPLRSSAIISWSWESDNHCLEDNPQNSSIKCYFRLVRVFEYQKVLIFFYFLHSCEDWWKLYLRGSRAEAQGTMCDLCTNWSQHCFLLEILKWRYCQVKLQVRFKYFISKVHPHFCGEEHVHRLDFNR